MLRREKEFLDEFCMVSPLRIPKFIFFGDRVLGYEKIRGQQLTADLFGSLGQTQKDIIAKDLGVFLAKLHASSFEITHISKYRDHFYRPGFDKLQKQINELLLPKFSPRVKKAISAFLLEFEANENNFKHKRGVVHSDLYDSHIYWDDKQQHISGIIDFGEVSQNASTMDFTLIANFCTPLNDVFLEKLLTAYNADDPDLFRRIKSFSKLEKLYWPIENIEANKIEPDRLNSLQDSLKKVVEVFDV